MWLILIVLHAAAGVAAFTTGTAALSWRQVERHHWIPSAVTWMMAGLILFMVGAMGAHWEALSGVERLVFSALSVLGGVMWWRARRAAQIAATSIGDQWSRYVDHVGFVLISLFNGFVIIAALDLGADPAIVATSAITAPIGGHLVITRHKHRNPPNAIHARNSGVHADAHPNPDRSTSTPSAHL
ncbi:MAG: hypothetical protein WKF60_01510 [Ilumatobacter sp.]